MNSHAKSPDDAKLKAQLDEATNIEEAQIFTLATVEDVVPLVADQAIVVFAVFELIRAIRAVHEVFAAAAGDDVVPLVPLQIVVAGSTVEFVVAVIAVDFVIVVVTAQNIVAIVTVEFIPAGARRCSRRVQPALALRRPRPG